MDTKLLRQKILDLAIHGKLVPQDPNDEPASVLLERIMAEKERLIKEGKIKAPKKSKSSDTSHYEKIEGPFEIPESWEWVRLGNIVEIVSAKRVLQSEWKHEGIPFYRAREIVKLSSSGYVDNDLFISNAHYQTLKDAFGVPQAGDIMLSAVGTIGKTYIVKKEDCFYYKDASVLCLRNVHNVNAQFLDLILQTPLLQKQMTAQSKGTTVETITIERALLYLLPIPPREEQIRIVNSTNQILNLLERINLESVQLGKAVSEAKNYILKLAISGKLVLQDSSDEPAIELLKRINPDFKPCDNSHYENLPDGWTICRMGDVIRLISGTSYDKSDVQESGIKILRGGNVQDGEIIERDDDVYVQMSREIAECNVRVGDIVIVASTGSADLIGKAGYIRKEYKYTQIGAFLRIARPIIRELSPYLNLIFSSEIYRSHIRVKAKGTNINNIKAAYINDFVIPLPPIDEQVRIVAAVKKYFGIIREIKAAL